MTLTDSELKLYKTCFEGLQYLYLKYSKYDKQIRDNIEWDNIDQEDLYKLLEMIGPSSTRFKIIRELEKMEQQYDHIV